MKAWGSLLVVLGAVIGMFGFLGGIAGFVKEPGLGPILFGALLLAAGLGLSAWGHRLRS